MPPETTTWENPVNLNDATCRYCNATAAIRIELRQILRTNPPGTASLAGAGVTLTGRLIDRPWAACRPELGGCGHESKGEIDVVGGEPACPTDTTTADTDLEAASPPGKPGERTGDIPTGPTPTAGGGVRALILPTGGRPYLTRLAPTLQAIQAVIGGPLEVVALGATAHLYVDEDGKYRTDPVLNPTATTLVNHFHPGFSSRDVIVGTAIALGTGSDGEETDCPPAIAALVGLT